MTKRDTNILLATRRLNGDEDFKVFLGWLRDSLAETKTALVRAESDAEIRQAQGAARTLDEILDCVGSTSDVLDKLSASR